jgi:hypothetical protein
VKGLIAVARREFAEHRLVVAAALISGLLAALVILLPTHVHERRDIREVAAIFVGCAFAAGLAIALGLSTMAGQLTNRRLGFYFARPLSAFQITAGKFGGATLLVLAAGIAGLAPGILANGAHLSREARLVAPAFLLFSIAVLLPFAHALGVAGRARSRWLGLDAAALSIAVVLSTLAARLLIRHLAIPALNRGMIALVVAVVAGLWVAGFVSVARGRTDAERAHRALSLTLWPIAAGGAALFLAYAGWTVSPRIGQIARIDGAVPAPRSSWVYVAGVTPGRGDYEAEFLYDTQTGQSVRVRNGGRAPLFSRDGRSAVWCEPAYAATGLPLLSRPWGSIHGEGCDVRRLSPSGLAGTSISFATVPRPRALSADASRLAAVTSERGSRTVSVHDLASGKLLGAAPLPADGRAFLVFAAPDRLRIFVDTATHTAAGEIQMLEYDLSARAVRELGRVALGPGYHFLRLSPDATRLLLVSHQVLLIDSSGTQPVTVLSSGPRWSRNAIFLEDGRVALAEADDAGGRVQIFSADGAPEKTIPIGGAGRLNLGAEVRPGVLVVARRAGTGAAASDDGDSFFVDVATGEIRSAGRNATPAATAMWWTEDPAFRLSAGDPGATLFIDRRAGALMRIDPGTGQRRRILPAR